jgi:hypothetical protein
MTKIKIVIQASLSLVLFLVLLFILKSIYLCLIVVISGNLIYYILESILNKYFQNQKRKALENVLIDEVLLLSSQPKANDLKQILGKLSDSKHRIISQEFTQIQRKVEAGHNIRELFLALSKKYKSEILDRFLELLLNSITTGTVSVADYRSFANNFFKSKQLIDERTSALLMQKYTIIFAGGLIVPGILGIVISLVKKLTSDLDFSLLQTIQGEAIASSGLFNVCYVCSIVYIIEYVIISSIYLGMLESDLKKSIIYLLFILPTAIGIFFISPTII